MSDNPVGQNQSSGRAVLHPSNLDAFTAVGSDGDTLRRQLVDKAQGSELFFQEVTGEDGQITVYGYPRTQVLDLIYEMAFPVIKLIDPRAAIKVKSNRSVSDFYVIVHTRRGGTYIGRHGLTLDAVETLVNHTVALRFPQWVNVYIDVDNYRRKRRAFLENQIRRMVRDIERDHRERPMKELLPKERKIVHQFFTEHPYLTTESRGEGRDRTLFITPRRDIQEA
jgi:predicted RNA-binding protein Jag